MGDQAASSGPGGSSCLKRMRSFFGQCDAPRGPRAPDDMAKVKSVKSCLSDGTRSRSKDSTWSDCSVTFSTDLAEVVEFEVIRPDSFSKPPTFVEGIDDLV